MVDEEEWRKCIPCGTVVSGSSPNWRDVIDLNDVTRVENKENKYKTPESLTW